tara:strand:- start:279 stop:521 length:243 start_codon:yes stop_codon:yes gene_type:complete
MPGFMYVFLALGYDDRRLGLRGAFVYWVYVDVLIDTFIYFLYLAHDHTNHLRFSEKRLYILRFFWCYTGSYSSEPLPLFH